MLTASTADDIYHTASVQPLDLKHTCAGEHLDNHTTPLVLLPFFSLVTFKATGKILRYTVTLFGPRALSGICSSNIHSGQRPTYWAVHTIIIIAQLIRGAADSCGAVRVSVSLTAVAGLRSGQFLMECFGHGVSLDGEPLDPHILPGTISLSLPIL